MQDILDCKQPPAADDDGEDKAGKKAGEDKAGKKAAHGIKGSNSNNSDSTSSISDSSSSEDELQSSHWGAWKLQTVQIEEVSSKIWQEQIYDSF